MIDAWPKEKQTHWYPGSAAGFEVTNAPCGHAAALEEEYYDEIMDRIGEMERDAQEAAAEARYEAWADRPMTRAVDYDLED